MKRGTLDFLMQQGLSTRPLFAAAFLSFIAAIFNLLSFWLLIPLARGIISGQFSSQTGPLGWLATGFSKSTVLPGSFSSFAVALVIVLLLRSACAYAARIMIAEQTRGLDMALRNTLFRRLLTFGKSYFDRTHSAQAARNIVDHSQRLSGRIKTLHEIAAQVFILVSLLLVMALISPLLTLLSVCIFPLFHVVRKSLTESIRQATHRQQRAHDTLIERVSDIAACMSFVQISRTETLERERFAEANRVEAAAKRTIDRRFQLIKPLEEIATVIVLLAVAAAAARLSAAAPGADISRYLVFFFAVRIAVPRLATLNTHWLNLARSADSLDRLAVQLSDKGKGMVPSGERPFTGVHEGIALRNLSFSYAPGRMALRKATATIPAGQVTALVGPNGSGKSTLLQLLLRLYDCPPEQVLIDGNDIRLHETTSLREKSLWLAQDIGLFDATLGDNIIYGLRPPPSSETIKRALETCGLTQFVDELPAGLETQVGEGGRQLSPGQRRRVALARAQLRRPEWLLLDEPTSGLDPVMSRSLWDTIFALAQGKTTIIATHDWSVLKRVDHIIYLDSGRVLESGAAAELLGPKGTLEALWASSPT
jgi:subfamily B ATP-binding cassette protein MsbA